MAVNRQAWCAVVLGLLLSAFASESVALDVAKARQQYAKMAFQVVDVSEVSYESGPAIGVTFSVPLAPDQPFDQYLNVSKKDGPRVEGGWILSESGTTAYFTNIEPVTTYSVTVYRGIAAVTGKQLKDTYEESLTTRHLQSHVAFASSGFVLPLDTSKGLPLYTININAVDVDFHRVEPEKIPQFLQSWGGRRGDVWSLQQYQSMMNLAHSGRFDLAAPKNKRHRTNLPVKDIRALRQPGLYVAVMKPAGSYPESYQVTYFVVSDIGLHARFYPERLDVFTHSLDKAAPIGGVKLSLLDVNGKVIGESRSTPAGQGTLLQPPAEARMLLAQKDERIALLDLTAPALDLSAFDLGKRPQRATEAFVYSPRDLYRPGETVDFNVLLRDGDGQLAGNPPLRAVLTGADEKEAENTTLHGDELGYYHHEFTLSSNAATGKWWLRLYIGSQVVGEYPFKVEEFLPERMKLTLDDGTQRARFVERDVELTIPVEGAYLYGAPASGNRLSSLVTIKQQRHPLEAYPDHQFGDVKERDKSNRIELEDIQLGGDGTGSVTVPGDWSEVGSPLDVQLVASLYESGGRPVVRDIHYTVWPASTVIGIRPLFKAQELDGNTLAGFEVIKADQEGGLHEAQDLEVKLVRENRYDYWVYTDDRGWVSEYTEKEYVAFNDNLTIGAAKRATVEVPVEWGWYRLEVLDSETGMRSSVRFYAGWWYGDGGDKKFSARPDRVELKLDKRHYRAGDVAKVTVIPPYAGEGFLLLEGDKQLFWKPIKAAAAGTVVEVPVDAAWRQHNLYLSAVIFRPGDTATKHLPNRAVGLLHFPLDREGRKLEVSILPEADKVLPETTMKTRVKVAGAQSGAKVMVTLAAVDVGVLNITDFVTPDAHRWFFEPRRYGIDSRDMYGAVIDSLEGGMASQRFGGDADLSRGGKKAQSEVQIVALFSGPVAVNAQGEAEIPMALPDFNGRLRLMALAYGAEQFGSAEQEITVASPIIAEISMPRFLANGDKSTITLDVQNLSGKPQQLSVSVGAQAPLQLSARKQDLTLADNAKVVLSFPLAATDDFGKGALTVDVRNNAKGQEKIDLSRRWSLSVRPPYPAVSRQLRAVLAKNDRITLGAELDGLMASTAEVGLTVSPRPPISLSAHLRQLLHYPYGCLEQTTSSTYPWMFATPDTVTRLNLSDLAAGQVNLAKRTEYLEAGLRRLSTFQLADGGFGLWDNAAAEEHWLTAYVADFITDAREQGVAVDSGMLEKTMQRLTQYVNTNGGMFAERWSQDSAHYRFSYRAYAAYVLSKINRAPLGALRNMYDQNRADAKSGLALVQLGVALIKQGDRARGMRAIEEGLGKPLATDRYYYLGDYGSPLRDTALMAYLLEKEKINVAGRSELIFKLADATAGQQYLSTQERLALFKAGVALSLSENTAWAGELLLGKSAQPVSGLGSYQRLFEGSELKNGLAFRSTSNDKLFAELVVTGYPKQAPAQRLDDIHVVREYYDINGKLLANSSIDGKRALPPLATGEMVVVHLRVSAKRRIPDALLVDLLPAGLELENQNLEHAVKLDRFSIDGMSMAELQSQNQGRVKHQEYRDDRFVAAFDLYEWGYADLFYLARAVTPGTYTVPPVYVEDMYRPYLQGISHTLPDLTIVKARAK
ncbi:MAG: alpha-2-macroglobulin [Pseudomonadota bacterium]